VGRCASSQHDAHLYCVTAVEDGHVIDLRTAEYWDIRDIQFHCRVSRSTAWRMVDEPDFPRRITYGRCVRWPRAEVMQFLEKRRAQPQPAERRVARASTAPAFTTRSVRRRSA
jgi:predicted DNA-binding transcriptional regulator AlpA